VRKGQRSAPADLSCVDSMTCFPYLRVAPDEGEE
jgi:hypothetical protein